MFIDQGMSGKEIAEILEVREATVVTWRKKGDWDKRREENIAAPHTIRAILLKELKNVAEGKKALVDSNALSQISKVVEALSAKISPQVTISVLKELDSFMLNEDPAKALEFTAYHRKFILHKINIDG